ncbi:MAG: LPS assembly lipoprotein LptE, partial [Hydrogenimonas sp.]|nr:LPS assembly lipoprotein LptE [Hydrogenimonas sp.]
MRISEWGLHKLLYIFAAIGLILFSVGCGYKPMTAYTKKLFTDKIYTEVEVYLRDPENAVLVKDAMNEAIVSRFGAKIAKKEDATTHLWIRFKSVRFSPIQYDANGYAVYYRANVNLSVRYSSPKSSGSESVSGFYDFPIEPNAVISDAKRFEAIRFGAQKALDEFIS